MKIIKTTLILGLFLLLTAGAANAALLNNNKINDFNNNTGNAAYYGSSSTYGWSSFNAILTTIIQAVLSVLGLIFLILTFIAGNSWMQAAGSEEKVEKAKDTIRNLLIGLGLLLVSYALSAGFGGLLSSALLK